MIECQYSEAVARMNRPSRLALALSKSQEGPANIITLGWFMRTSIKPPMFAISVGLTRYSHELLAENRNFVLAIPSTNMAEITMKCGIHSGREINKIKAFKIKIRKGKLTDIPLLADAVANFECKTITQVRSGDHTIFVGEVKYSWQNQDEGLEQLLSIPMNDSRFEELMRKGGYSFGIIKGKK
ncbi:MAG TPA: flavin reductase family protein [Candidatus Cloacimonetes bacterium]|nr:flavin reductase family protein [Candidatus Cloacimonadota bacterium]HEX37393.1 flavin reductase family protein [Candidatus Cloacimonadota bacterium]